MSVVTVPERGHTDLDFETWRSLSAESSFWSFVQKGVVSISLPERGRVRLDGKCYLGRAQLGDITLEMVDKVPGALAALLGFAGSRTFRLEEMTAPATELGDLARLLVRSFLRAVRSYVSEGRDSRYATRASVGSLIGGRIDMTRTLRLRARGFRHLAAFERNVLLRNTPKNRVVLAALQAVERMSRIVELGREDITSARSLVLLFSDCRDREVLFADRMRFVRYAQRLAEDPRERRHQDLLTLASVVLSHQSFEPAAPFASTVPRAWFLNLETLFETAVRRVLRVIAPPDMSVAAGTRQSPAIFERAPGIFKAKPDLVLRRNHAVAAIGDVKYKHWDGSAVEADLYQLLVHAATFDARRCFLVFPHDRFEVMELGRASTGCQTWLFAVDVRRLKVDLRDVLSSMEIPLAGNGAA